MRKGLHFGNITLASRMKLCCISQLQDSLNRDEHR